MSDSLLKRTDINRKSRLLQQRLALAVFKTARGLESISFPALEASLGSTSTTSTTTTTISSTSSLPPSSPIHHHYPPAMSLYDSFMSPSLSSLASPHMAKDHPFLEHRSASHPRHARAIDLRPHHAANVLASFQSTNKTTTSTAPAPAPAPPPPPPQPPSTTPSRKRKHTHDPHDPHDRESAAHLMLYLAASPSPGPAPTNNSSPKRRLATFQGRRLFADTEDDTSEHPYTLPLSVPSPWTQS